MKIVEALKQGPRKVSIIKGLEMGGASDSDILEFVDAKYLTIGEEGNVIIHPQENVSARLLDNGLIDLTFDDGKSSQDVIFEYDDEDEYLKIVS